MKVPKGEELCVSYYDTSGKNLFIMTRDLFGITYFLYEVCDDKIKKLGKAGSPIELEKKHSVNDTILVKR